MRETARILDQDEGLKRIRQLKEDLRDSQSIEDIIKPPTPRQIRYSARLEEALNLGLEKYHESRDDLVRKYGFTLKEVRVAPDLRSAFIQWSCFPGQEEEAAIMLRRVERRVVDIAFKKYKSWTFPRLIWRTEAASEVARKTERAFEALVSMEEEDALYLGLEKLQGPDRAETTLRRMRSRGGGPEARKALGAELSQALGQLEREEVDLEKRRIEAVLGSVNLRPKVRERLLERLQQIEGGGGKDGLSPYSRSALDSCQVDGQGREAERENAMLAAVMELEALERGEGMPAAELNELREFLEGGELESLESEGSKADSREAIVGVEGRGGATAEPESRS